MLRVTQRTRSVRNCMPTPEHWHDNLHLPVSALRWHESQLGSVCHKLRQALFQQLVQRALRRPVAHEASPVSGVGRGE